MAFIRKDEYCPIEERADKIQEIIDREKIKDPKIEMNNDYTFITGKCGFLGLNTISVSIHHDAIEK